MDIAETIAERKIREAMEQGMFERLEGAGRSIEDLDRVREPGWWARSSSRARTSPSRPVTRIGP